MRPVPRTRSARPTPVDALRGASHQQTRRVSSLWEPTIVSVTHREENYVVPIPLDRRGSRGIWAPLRIGELPEDIV